MLGGVEDTESPAPSSGAWKDSDATATPTAPQNGTDQADGRPQTRLTLSSLIAVPAAVDGTALRQAQQALAAVAASATDAADNLASALESPLPSVVLAPPPQRHPTHTKPARGLDGSVPLVKSPAVSDAAVPLQIQLAASDARTSLTAPQMLGEQPSRDELWSESAAVPAAANSKEAALGATPAVRLGQSDSRTGPAAATRWAEAPPALTDELLSPTAADAASVSSLHSAERPADDASGLAAGPEPSIGQSALASTASGAGDVELVAQHASARQTETRLPNPAVRFTSSKAAQPSQETSSIAASVQTASVLYEKVAPVPLASVPLSVTTTADAGSAARSADSLQPAQVSARNGGTRKVTATAFPWVPRSSISAQDLPASRCESPEETIPTDEQTVKQTLVESPSEDQATDKRSLGAVSTSGAPALAKVAGRRARAQELPTSRGSWPGNVVAAPDAPSAAKSGEPSAPVKQGDLRLAAEQAPTSLSSNATATPCPEPLPAADPVSVPSHEDTPAQSRNRISSAHILTTANTHSVSGGLEGTVVANFAEDAVSGASGNGSPAGRIAFEALLTQMPQASSGNSPTPARENAVQGNSTQHTRIEIPEAGKPQQAEVSDDASSPVENAETADGGGALHVGQKQHPAADAGRIDPAARSDASRKPATAAATPTSAGTADAPSAAAVRGVPVNEPVSGLTRSDNPAPSAAAPVDRTMEARLAQDQPKAATTAHDMRFAMGAGDQRVEVRVAERGGEVHVDVRTPDERLAGSLRDDLPSLTAKLESAGLRAETWHADSSSGAGRERQQESAGQTESQNSQERPGQDGRRQQDDPPPQRPKESDDSSHSKRDRKDFQWLFTSLQ